jgi:hypothetical protein
LEKIPSLVETRVWSPPVAPGAANAEDEPSEKLEEAIAATLSTGISGEQQSLV